MSIVPGYANLPGKVVSCSFNYTRFGVENGQKKVMESGSFTSEGKIYRDKISPFMQRALSELKQKQDKFILLLPSSAPFPNSNDYDFKILIDGVPFEYIRSHNAFGHYSIECYGVM